MTKAETWFFLRLADKIIVREIWPADLQIGLAVIVVRDEVSLGNFQGVTEKTETIFPIAGLPPGKCRKENQANDGRTGEYFRAVRDLAGMVGNPPHGQHKNSEQRRVRIPVGHGLATDLHKSDHRHKAAEIPEPANNQITMLQTTQAEPRNEKNKKKRHERLPQAEMVFRMRIKNRQVE